MSTNDLFSHPSVLAPDEDRILEYACVAASELMGPNTPLTDYVDTFANFTAAAGPTSSSIFYCTRRGARLRHTPTTLLTLLKPRWRKPVSPTCQRPNELSIFVTPWTRTRRL